jgi:hypothetical protein
VFHREKEMEKERAVGAERQESHKKSCANIYEALKLDLTKRSIKFALGLWRKEKNPDCFSQASIQNGRGANW